MPEMSPIDPYFSFCRFCDFLESIIKRCKYPLKGGIGNAVISGFSGLKGTELSVLWTSKQLVALFRAVPNLKDYILCQFFPNFSKPMNHLGGSCDMNILIQ